MSFLFHERNTALDSTLLAQTNAMTYLVIPQTSPHQKLPNHYASCASISRKPDRPGAIRVRRVGLGPFIIAFFSSVAERYEL